MKLPASERVPTCKKTLPPEVKRGPDGASKKEKEVRDGWLERREDMSSQQSQYKWEAVVSARNIRVLAAAIACHNKVGKDLQIDAVRSPDTGCFLNLRTLNENQSCYRCPPHCRLSNPVPPSLVWCHVWSCLPTSTPTNLPRRRTHADERRATATTAPRRDR